MRLRTALISSTLLVGAVTGCGEEATSPDDGTSPSPTETQTEPAVTFPIDALGEMTPSQGAGSQGAGSQGAGAGEPQGAGQTPPMPPAAGATMTETPAQGSTPESNEAPPPADPSLADTPMVTPPQAMTPAAPADEPTPDPDPAAPADTAPTPSATAEPTSTAPDEPTLEPEEEIVFQTAAGTIPNAPLPESMVDLGTQSWQQGLVSPSMLQGHQINQPTVVNGYLLVGGNEEYWFFDISDPSAPQELSYAQTPNRRAGGEAESHTISFARYGDDFYMVTIGGTGIDTWNVNDPNNLQHVGKIGIPGTNYGDYTEAIWGVSWQGQYIYVGATNNGIKVVDASDPASLQLVAEVPTSAYGGVSAGALDAIGNVLVVTTPKETGGVATLDISDPENPTRLSSFTTDISYIGGFYRHYVFLIGPLRAWDVLTDPRNIGTAANPLGQLPTPTAEYITFSDDVMFLGHVREEIGGTPGSSTIDISNVSQMRVDGRVYGRMNLGGLNDDQFNLPIGNLLFMGDDQAPYPGWVLAAYRTDPDTKAPEVDTVIPKDGSMGNSTQSRIGVSFSDNIELATVNADSFFVRPVGGDPLPGKYGARMGVVNFDPDEDLQPGTTYEVVLRAGGVADVVGNTLESEWVSTFTTN